MTPVKCQTCNLFYDSEKYTQCPHCAKGGPLPKPSYSRTEQHSRHTQSDNMTQKTETTEKPIKKRNKFLFLFKNKKDEKAEEPIKNAIPAKDEMKNQKLDNSSLRKKENSVNNDLPATENVKAPLVENNEKQSSEAQQPLSISEAVKKAESIPVTADQKTVAHYNFSNSIEPVTGWLVCIKGEYKGESFNIKAGRSSIGRSLTMDISLAKEKSVSRERHASVIFEPNKRLFYIQSGDSSGLTYVNDNLVLTVQELKEKDVITLGESKFIFISLAGETFSWANYA